MSAPDYGALTRIFWRIGILSFGGPAAQIALMHRELVEERPWLSEKEYLSALSFCMLLPGPEAMQLATYAGWKLRGVPGGLIAGLLFVIPGALVVLALSLLYATLGAVPLVQAMFLGVQAAVVMIVIEALLKVSKRALTSNLAWVIAGLSFVAIFALQVPFPAIIALAAILGATLSRPAPAEPAPEHAASPGHTLRTIAIWAAIWAAPMILIHIAGGGLLADIGLFFSKLAVVTFGGAYAVLAYMTQEVVQDQGWLTTAQMIDGLGLAETTPGPLILVTQFVGFMAGYQQGGLMLGLAAALVTLWVTFAPCFLWIFAGAPWIGWIGTRPRLAAALQGVTAAVVGVILNLSLWFAVHVLFTDLGEAIFGPIRLIAPDPGSFDWRAGALAVLAGILIFRLHWGLPAVLAVAAAGGALLSAL